MKKAMTILCVLVACTVARAQDDHIINTYRSFAENVSSYYSSKDTTGLKNIRLDILKTSLTVPASFKQYFIDEVSLCNIYLAIIKYREGEYDKAIALLEQEESTHDDKLRHYCHSYLYYCHNRKATLFSLQGNYGAALKELELAASYAAADNNAKNAASAYIDMAEVHFNLGNSAEGNNCLTIAESSSQTPYILGKIAYLKGSRANVCQDYEQALLQFEKSYNIRKEASDFANAYNSANALAELYSGALFNNDRRRYWAAEAESMKRMADGNSYTVPDNMKGEWNEKLFVEYVNKYKKAMQLYTGGDYGEAKSKLLGMLTWLDGLDKVPASVTADIVSLIGNVNTANGHYAEAVASLEEAQKLYLDCTPPSLKDAAETARHRSYALFAANERGKALEAAREAADLAIKGHNPWDTGLVDAFYNLANLEAFAGNKPQACDSYRQAARIVESNVRRNFSYLTSEERASYWNANSGTILGMASFADALGESYSSFTDALYDQQLLMKGLLLQSDISLRQAVATDTVLSDIMQQIHNLRAKASDPSTAYADARAAMNESDRLERDLTRRSSEARVYLSFLSIDRRSIKESLRNGETAIEFVTYPKSEGLTVTAAIIQQKGAEHARFIPLFDSSQIATIDNPYADSRAFHLVWDSVLPYTEAAGAICFAPSGPLNSIAIEYLPDDNSICLADKRTMRRLTSTRTLAMAPDDIGRDATVYGGIFYDRNMTWAEAKIIEDSAFGSERGSIRNLYLPWSRLEADEVGVLLDSIPSMSAEVLSGDAATEASFRALSGKKRRLIHIATHGFYSTSELNAMTGSGLLLYGSQNSFRRGAVYPVADDGILTAEEIAGMDLRGLELVVLSACQTGLGSVSSEGVFGLQRGFKMAGAESILMSLWPVDDQATRMFMKEFYTKWLEGAEESEALKHARHIVSSRYSDPKYWAAFVLLDGK